MPGRSSTRDERSNRYLVGNAHANKSGCTYYNIVRGKKNQEEGFIRLALDVP